MTATGTPRVVVCFGSHCLRGTKYEPIFVCRRSVYAGRYAGPGSDSKKQDTGDWSGYHHDNAAVRPALSVLSGTP
jgi:hypothetical protein